MDRLLQLTQYFSLQGDVILLHSQSQSHPASRVSYLAALPQAFIKAQANTIITQTGENKTIAKDNSWDALNAFRNKHPGWIFGYIGYDLKNHIEKLESANWDKVEAPDMYFMSPGFLLRYGHSSEQEEVLIGDMPNKHELAKVSQKKHKFELGELQLQTSRAKYLRKIDKAQHYIAEGDFYEINLSHQMNARFEGVPFELYRQMGRKGPVPFGSYLQVDDIHICSQSPERFLKKEGTTVFSQPIKGTSKRGVSSGEDQSLKKALLSSQKERAENLMIVDLVRNDLSKIARNGSVKVPRLFEIQSFDTVHQMVSTVQAKTSQEDPITILKACFPMGSMTGAPKISAMQSIEELEDYKRGIYSGAIGYITPESDFDFNVVIRTAIIKNNRLYYSVGGAITGDSDPQKEWEETQIKARALVDVAEYSQKV